MDPLTESSGCITLTLAADNLSGSVSEFPGYISNNHTISGVKSSAQKEVVLLNGMFRPDESIQTGHKNNFRVLSQSN